MVVFGIVCFFFMFDMLVVLWFLIEEEWDWVLKRMKIDVSGFMVLEIVDEEKFDWFWVWMVIKLL